MISLKSSQVQILVTPNETQVFQRIYAFLGQHSTEAPGLLGEHRAGPSLFFLWLQQDSLETVGGAQWYCCRSGESP